MPAPTPFLDLDDRVRYLYERDYFPAGTLTDEHRARLEKLNFHYFLGYARNYRMLVGRGLIDRCQKDPDDVFELIEMDHKVAGLLYGGLRRAEWSLRSSVVEHYCDHFTAADSFLRPDQYLAVDQDSPQEMVERLLSQIIRYGEPYVDAHIKTAAEETGHQRPKQYERASHDLCASYVRDLPLWSVIDSFTLGLLSRFITQCDPRGGNTLPVWKEVAQDLEVATGIFLSNIESLTVLRNLVAHHARLWMRPTTNSPRAPKYFKSQLRGTDPKAMRVAFLNLALFQGRDGRDDFATAIDNLLRENPIYYYGVTKVHHPSEADRRHVRTG